MSSSRLGTPQPHKSPVPNYEKPLYDKLLEMQTTLLTLKNNRSKYINSKQIYSIYDQFLNSLHELKITRKDEELKGLTLVLPNLTDAVVDDIWQLLSLCFVTCGLIKFAPATYSSLSTVNKLLDHLKECQVYTLDDLEPIRQRLAEIKEIITNNDYDEHDDLGDDFAQDVHDSIAQTKNIHKVEENLLLRNKLNKCQTLYKQLEDSFRNFPEDLEPTYNQLIKLRKSILQYVTHKEEYKNANKETITTKIGEAKQEIKSIQSKRDSDGLFHSKFEENDQEKLNNTQTVLNGLLDDCNNLLHDLSIQSELSLESLFGTLTLDDKEPFNQELKTIHKNFESIYYKLIELKTKLENLLVTRRWTMRETDLYSFQKSLKDLDDERILLNNKIGKINSAANEESISTANDQTINQQLRKNQILILYLLRRNYSLIYKLLESSEPVSESLQPIHNQLSTVRKCLLEIKRVDGLNNTRELYPFQFKLASLDNLRSDGKFIINGQIPEGQGTLNALLAECFDIIHELKIELEEKEEEQEDGLDEPSSQAAEYTDDEDIKSDDEVELKRGRFKGFNEADYDKESESAFEDDDDYSFSDSEYEGNDYY